MKLVEDFKKYLNQIYFTVKKEVKNKEYNSKRNGRNKKIQLGI